MDRNNSYKEKTVIEENTSSYWKFWTRRRYVLTLMLFLGFFNVYSLRVNLSVAIVAMTSPKTDANGQLIEPEFKWDSKQRGYVLSSFFYGYICTQLLGGLLARKISGHILYGMGIASTAIFTLLTPLAAKAGLATMITIRVLEGIFEGVTYPCLHAIWSKWAPPLERSRMNSIAFAGSYIGTVVIMPVSGIIAENFSWESVFYITGAIAVLWYILWLILIRASPETDPYISNDERDYIVKSIGASDDKNVKIPWKGILTSTAVLAILTANFSENWGFYTLLTQMPSYLEDVMSFNLGQTGFLSGLPYLTMGLMLFVSGFLADWVQEKRYMTTIQVRKVFNCGAFIVQCAFLILAAYLNSPAGSVACLTLGVGLGAFSISGFAVNALDIAPQFASVIMGIQNTFGTIPGIVSPIISGYIVQDGTENQWRIVFYISAGVYLIGALVYWFFAKGELQPWASETAIITKDAESNYGSVNRSKAYRNEGLDTTE